MGAGTSDVQYSFVVELMAAGLRQLLNRINNDLLELFTPNGIQLINFLILSNSKLRQIPNKALSSFSILFGLKSIVFDLQLPILLTLITMGLLLNFWREDCWGGEDFVKVLELLPRLLLVGICNLIAVDFRNIWKSVDNERSEEYGVGDFVVFDGQGGEALEGFQFRNLNETVNIVVLE